MNTYTRFIVTGSPVNWEIYDNEIGKRVGGLEAKRSDAQYACQTLNTYYAAHDPTRHLCPMCSGCGFIEENDYSDCPQCAGQGIIIP